MENNFASNLKYLRKQSGMTQGELAKKLGKDYSTIGKWELGHRSPIMSDVIKVAELFNISLENLIRTSIITNNQVEPIFDELEILFNKAKGKLDPSQEATIKFVMRDAIEKYEKEKNNK